MTADEQKAMFERVIEEGFNQGNVSVLDECYPAEYLEHQFDLPSNLADFKGSVAYLHHTFAPFSLTIKDLVVDNDKVWARLIAQGTDSQGLNGQPATGKSFTITVIDICRFADGKIVEHWGVPDRFHQLVQLGVIPQP